MKYYKILLAVCLIISLPIAGALLYLQQKGNDGVLILEYHKVNNDDNDEYTTPVNDFEEQLDYLTRQGYKTISIMDFVRAKKYGEKLPAKSVILTFDDGYEDNYTDVMPFLKDHAMKGTVFIIANDVGQPGYLSWQQIKDMQSTGMEIGSHTANHLPLTTLSASEIDSEIKLSKLLMEWKGLKTIYFFSYPNGAYNITAEQDLKQYGYLAAVTGDPGINKFSTDPFLLQRTYIPRLRFGMTEFKLRILKSKLYSVLNIKQNKL
ncbi:polysaccharide deacetylase family protein [Pectinatus frisingensis]|uniref:polysaccharide deacetylase family protein n=1 Tax=Pectinatus frisingensis TaxID=865 RepID=UPI001E433C0C|nr:polysaccharide deacetylase family protein [Pectinatus frisingensis]